MGGGGSSPCASCKLLRRRCTKDCIFAPYFPPSDPHKFAIVHKVFGASNISKMLQELPVDQRGDAVSSLVYEANARVRDPVYGCVGAISYLQNQVSQLQMQLAVAQTEILCIQMQQQEAEMGVGVGVGVGVSSAYQIETDHHEKSMLNHFNTINGALPQCLSFASSASTAPRHVVVQDPLKRESSWT